MQWQLRWSNVRIYSKSVPCQSYFFLYEISMWSAHTGLILPTELNLSKILCTDSQKHHCCSHGGNSLWELFFPRSCLGETPALPDCWARPIPGMCCCSSSASVELLWHEMRMNQAYSLSSKLWMSVLAWRNTIFRLMWFDTKFSAESGQPKEWAASRGTGMSDGQALFLFTEALSIQAQWHPGPIDLHKALQFGPYAMEISLCITHLPEGPFSQICCCFWKVSCCRASREHVPSITQWKGLVTDSCWQVHKQNRLKMEKSSTFTKTF